MKKLLMACLVSLCCGCDDSQPVNNKEGEEWCRSEHARWEKGLPTYSDGLKTLIEGVYDRAEFLVVKNGVITIVHFQDGRTYALTGMRDMECPRGVKIRVVMRVVTITYRDGTVVVQERADEIKIVAADVEAK